MKEIISGKIIALGLIFIAFLTTYYLYREGEITFLPKKEPPVIEKSNFSEFLITEKQYKLSYKDKFDTTFDIANFENNESWFGDGNLDFSTYFEGESSLFLSSFNNLKAAVWLKKNFDIKDILNFKFLVYLATDPTFIEEFKLIFSGGNKAYQFPVRELKRGWNFLVLPKESFSSFVSDEQKEEGVVSETEIGKVTIELISRPNVRSIVNLDLLWAEKKDAYFEDWNLNSQNFLALRRIENTTCLLVINLADNRATLRKGSGGDYTFQAKFTPLKKGEFGFFLRGDYKSGYGYYLVMNGIETSDWKIYKYGPFEKDEKLINLAKGKIGNLILGKNQAYWLKANLKGKKITFYLSQDGKNFITLGEVDDESFSSGGIGITVGSGNMVFIDDLAFFR